MPVNVALWEPDIRPPLDWLIPSVLYQEKISTLAPFADRLDRDGRQAYDLEQQLGELYVPLSLSDVLYPPDDLEALLDLLRSRLPVWSRWIKHRSVRIDDHYSSMWLGRSAGWPERRARLAAAVGEAVAAVRIAREEVELRAEQLPILEAEVTPLLGEVERRRPAVREELAREKAYRREAYAETLRRRSELITPEGRWGLDLDTDSAIRKLDADLKRIRPPFDGTPRSPQRQDFDRACDRLGAALAARNAARIELHNANHKLTVALRRLAMARQLHAVPWCQDSNSERWLRPGNLVRELPPSLETMGAGKVYGEVFEFLATEAGMWVSQSRPRHYMGSLVGPREVVDDVISIVTEWYCGSHDGWVQMSAATNPRENINPGLGTSEELVTLGICWLLPVPVAATLAEARSFRQSHEDELQHIRETISAAMPGLGDIDDLRSAIRDAEVKISEPLAAVERALELERSITLRHTKQTVLYHIGSGLNNLIASVAAAGVALPALGNTISSAALIATVGGGVALTATGLAGHQVHTRIALARSRRTLQNSPYKYLYDVGQRFGPSARTNRQ
jgi:hypothetical protein